jgi:hypothetical protein
MELILVAVGALVIGWQVRAWYEDRISKQYADFILDNLLMQSDFHLNPVSEDPDPPPNSKH